MAIHHLLYACVICRREAGIRVDRERGAERCLHCGATYERAAGALIRVQPAEGRADTRHPAEWLDLLDQSGMSGARDLPERVVVRHAQAQRPYRHRGMYLGHVERFGERIDGRLSLTPEAVVFESAAGREVWPLAELTAVQPSSKTLQLRLSNATLVAIEFPEGSPLLWEERVRQAVQRHYTMSGRGRITEYQPRIVCT